jgi:hypothetical protein
MENEKSARVTKLTGYGEKRMRDAIAQGLVEGDLRRDMERTLHDTECARRENLLLRGRVAAMEDRRRNDMARRLAAYERQRDAGRRRKAQAPVHRVLAVVALLTGAGLCVAILTLTAWLIAR